jgi:transcriptional regulator with XRE-family HTH domain
MSFRRRAALRPVQGSFLPEFRALYIRQNREKVGLSVEEAACRAGMEVSEWVEMEQGWIPSWTHLPSIAAVLDVPQESLPTLEQLCRRPLKH